MFFNKETRRKEDSSSKTPPLDLFKQVWGIREKSPAPASMSVPVSSDIYNVPPHGHHARRRHQR